MEIEFQDEKSIDSFQAEMDLVKEEEETENRLSQKERLNQMLSKIKSQNEQEESPEQNQVLRSNPNVLRAAQKKIEVSDSNEPFDPNFKLNQRYFYQNININEWNEINSFIEKFIEQDMNENDLDEFFDNHPKISKGNVVQLQNAIEKIFSEKQNLEKYKILINYIIKKYFKPKPVICECYFFPNPSNEQRVVSMFRTCKKTLDLAIFTFTRDSIAQAILEAYQRGVKVRCIGDDGNSKVKGSDVRLLASVGIPCKTDNNLRFHMHNKMAIIDNSVVITGSFNWTSQAVNKNQDNILFIEDKNIANQYTDYYNQIWESFNTVITQEEAKLYIENEKKAEQEKKAQKEKQGETTKKEENKKEPTKKETTKKETTKKESTKKETSKKEATKKESTKKETAKKETTKKETTKKESTKKESTKKETTKKETPKKEPAKKETSKKETSKKEPAKKTSVSKEKKTTTTKKSESKPKSTSTKKSESKPKDKKETSTKKATEKKKETSTKKKANEKKEAVKKSKSVTKEKKKETTKEKKISKSKTQTKPKTVKEKKKEKNEKRKPAINKRVRGVKTDKEKNKKKK